MAGGATDRERAALALGGCRVAVTRPASGAESLAIALEEAGAVAVRMPLLRVAPAGDADLVREAARRLDEYDWIVFTSANAVHHFAAAVHDTAAVGRPAAAAVGPATAAAAGAAGFRVVAVPESHVAAAVAATIAEIAPLAGARVLWPCAATARRDLPEALVAAGARVAEVVVYATEPDAAAAAELVAAVAQGRVDVLTFTSPSAVRAYADAGGKGEACTVAVIGPVTAAAAHAAGLPVHVQAEEHTAGAMVDALRAFLNRRERPDTA